MFCRVDLCLTWAEARGFLWRAEIRHKVQALEMLKEKKPSRGPAVVYYNPERKQSSLCILLSRVCFNVSAFMFTESFNSHLRTSRLINASWIYTMLWLPVEREGGEGCDLFEAVWLWTNCKLTGKIPHLLWAVCSSASLPSENLFLTSNLNFLYLF